MSGLKDEPRAGNEADSVSGEDEIEVTELTERDLDEATRSAPAPAPTSTPASAVAEARQEQAAGANHRQP